LDDALSGGGAIVIDYQTFLDSKRLVAAPAGFEVASEQINPYLFPFQRNIVRWALRRGRAAIFADCGLGKTPMQLEWACHVAVHTDRPVLILAPLAVAQQTAREGEKFGIGVTVCRCQADVQSGVNVTNYEMLHHFDPQIFGGIVLDESSILKAFGGVMRGQITAFGQQIAYRLACTATPAPNDLVELTNHAEFLDVMSGKEIIALFFTQDGNTTHAWRLKGHAKQDFWRWMASWSVALRRPSDLGYSDDGFVLPELRIEQRTVEAPAPTTTLFPVEALSLQERQQARRESTDARVAACATLVNASDDAWLVWCDLNRESEALAKAIPGAVEVTGSDTPDHKTQAMLDFAEGRIRVLVSKPSICGFGMNWQHCHNVAFVGLSDSYEQFYQAVRRCWRFGQQRPVSVYLITAETEGAVVKNIERKEQQARDMMDNIVAHMADLSLDGTSAERDEMVYREDIAHGRDWTLYLGDCIRRIDEIADASVGLSVFSPPFPGMYAYTNSAHDIGNTTSIDEFMQHFAYLAPKLLRVTMPGRMCCVHLMQLTAMKSRDGYIGVKDYRGKTIEMMERAGWVYAGEATIDKNPQVQATRNKERGLLFKTLATDSSLMRMALADYLLYFRKPGENPRPIRAGVSNRYDNPNGWITEQEWIEWAAPVWYRQSKHYPGGIRETDVLNVVQARETDDERHLCPLQLGVIERAIKLWSAPGDLVLSPFTGVGSEGYEAVRLGRRFVGIELKESYYRSAIRNLERAEREKEQPTLFDLLPAEEAA
jgi:DNA modification methylase